MKLKASVGLLLLLVATSYACLPSSPIRATKSGNRVTASDGCGNTVTLHVQTINGKADSIQRYEGGKSDLVSDDDLRELGFGESVIKVMHGMRSAESGGRYGTLNTWDGEVRDGCLVLCLVCVKDARREREKKKNAFASLL